jgi:hypothetical protein
VGFVVDNLSTLNKIQQWETKQLLCI